MPRRPIPLFLVALATIAVACSSTEPQANPKPPGSNALTTPIPGTTTKPTSDVAAEAKTAVTEFFEKKAVNNYADALKRSSGAAKLTIDWAADINGIKAVDKTPYALSPVAAPNVRVQIDKVEPNGDQLFVASGFVELGSRPSGVASTTTTSAAPGANQPAATFFVIDLSFAKGDAGALTVDDYRLDDTAYPVSQLFTNFTDAKTSSGSGTTIDTASKGTSAPVGATEVTLRLGHRDVDGSVQYDLSYKGVDGTKMTKASFARKTSPTPTTRSASNAIGATVYADPIVGGEAGALVVRPGAFPGESGTLQLTFEDAQKKTSAVDLAVPDWPAPTARPVNQLRDRITASSTTSSSATSTEMAASTTSTSAVPVTVTVTVTVPGPTVTATVPGSTTTTKMATTSTSSTLPVSIP